MQIFYTNRVIVWTHFNPYCWALPFAADFGNYQNPETIFMSCDITIRFLCFSLELGIDI